MVNRMCCWRKCKHIYTYMPCVYLQFSLTSKAVVSGQPQPQVANLAHLSFSAPGPVCKAAILKYPQPLAAKSTTRFVSGSIT